MDRKKHRWWMLLIPALVIILMVTIKFRDAIFIRLAPKAVLTSALTEVYAQLESRFADDPLLILFHSVDGDGKYTADAKLDTMNEYLGSVSYDMVIQTDASSHRLLAEGMASTSDKQLELSLYMDADVMAISSASLLGSNYYGITYETFAEDIRNIPLLSFFVSDHTLSQWDASVNNIQEQMNRSCTLFQLPDISKEDMQKVTVGLLALPCEVENITISIDSVCLDCQAVTYNLGGDQVDAFLSNTSLSENASISVTFYLYKNDLVKIQLNCASASNSVMYGLTLGQNPAEDILCLQKSQKSDEDNSDFRLSVETQRSQEGYKQVWDSCSFENQRKEERSLSYNWIPENGLLELQPSDTAEPIELILSEAENGFQIETEHFSQLMAFLSQSNQEKRGETISGTVTIAKGSQITTPAYKNLDQWSMEDLLTLLSGIGSLVGINIGL